MKTKLLYILPILTVVLYLVFFLILGPAKTFFYNLDPDVVYVTNALLYAKSGIIAYADHPGTPTIMLLYLSQVPIRLFVKYIIHMGFIDWSYINFTFLMFYSRLIELAAFGAGIYLFLKSVSIFAKTKISIFVSWLLLFIFIGLTWGMIIAPEVLTLLFTSIWLYVFSKFQLNSKYSFTITLSFVAGIATANKFTAIFLVLASLVLPLFDKTTKIGQKLLRLEINAAVSVAAFYLGIRPAIMQLGYMKDWVLKLFTHPGIYGTGESTLFNVQFYSSSFSSLVGTYYIQFGLVLFGVALAVYLLAKKKLVVNNPIVILVLVSMIGILVFAKYPRIHYMLVNFILMTYSIATLLEKLNTKFAKVFVVLLTLIFLSNTWGYIRSTTTELNNNINTVEDVLREWTPFWALNIFENQLGTTSQP